MFHHVLLLGTNVQGISIYFIIFRFSILVCVVRLHSNSLYSYRVALAYPTLSAPCLWRLQFGFNQAASPSRSGSQFAHFTATVNLRCARSSSCLQVLIFSTDKSPDTHILLPFSRKFHTLNTPTHLWAYSNYSLCSIKLGKSPTLQDRVASETQSSRRPFILLECLTQHGGILLTICRYLCYPIPSTSMSSQVRQILGSSHRIWN